MNFQLRIGKLTIFAPSFYNILFSSIQNMVNKMNKWECSVCGYVYDPEIGDLDHNIQSGTSFEKLPEDWVCPICGAPKSQFVKQ